MFEGKYTTIRTVIENIQRDLGNDYELNIYDIAEWTWKAMDSIGARIAMEEKIAKIEIEENVGELPFDFKSIISIRPTDSQQSLVYSSDVFLKDNIDNDKEYEYALGVNTYKIDNKYIFTDFSDGELTMAYNAIRLDDEGFPLVPDETRYLDAVEAYIRFKLDFIGYRRGTITRAMYKESERHWFYTCKSAFNKMVVPNYDKAEALKKQINNMLGDKGSHNRGFRTLDIETVNKLY